MFQKSLSWIKSGMKAFLRWYSRDRVQEGWNNRGSSLSLVRFEHENGVVLELKGKAANEWWHDLFWAINGRTVDWSRHKFIRQTERGTNPDQFHRFIGRQFRAKDGGDYGIYVVGCIPEKNDLVVMSVSGDKVRYDEEPRRLDAFKASYRYQMD
jgi:hypothetical protein